MQKFLGILLAAAISAALIIDGYLYCRGCSKHPSEEPAMETKLTI